MHTSIYLNFIHLDFFFISLIAVEIFAHFLLMLINVIECSIFFHLDVDRCIFSESLIADIPSFASNLFSDINLLSTE